jgi:hypothetical protein
MPDLTVDNVLRRSAWVLAGEMHAHGKAEESAFWDLRDGGYELQGYYPFDLLVLRGTALPVRRSRDQAPSGILL